MQNKKNILQTFLILLFALIFALPLSAQESRFKQKLEWEKDANALEYKVEIIGVSNSGINKTIKTEKTSVEFSMDAGDYKYRVFAYDFLGREASVTEWKTFTITKALKPKVNLKDTTVTVDGRKKRPVTIPVDVESITNETTLTFVNTETGEEIKGKINTEKNKDGTVSSKSVVFPDVSVGDWKMVVTNPSGLSTESEVVQVAPQGKKLVIGKPAEKTEAEEKPAVTEKPVEEKPAEEKPAVAETPAEEEKPVVAEVPSEKETASEPDEEIEEEKDEEVKPPKEKKPYVVQDITLSVGFVSPFAIADDYFASLNNKPFDYGLKVSLAWLPIDIKNWKLGFEAGYTNTFINYSNSLVDIFLPMNIAHLCVVGRFNLFDGKLGINAKAGAGASIINKTVTYPQNTKPDVETKHYGYINVTAGASVDWIPFKHLITELGADVHYIIMPDVNAFVVCPYVSVGVRF